ncbi:hypothetical protein T484DRAFT_1827120, partial [Baffinella frigidus]
LKRELGDVPVERALEDGAGWTGRAQQISLLQSKVTQLKRDIQQISLLQSKGTQLKRDIQPSSPQAERVFDSASRVDELHRAQIDKVEKDRRKEAEHLQEQLLSEREGKEALLKRASAAVEKDRRKEADQLQEHLLSERAEKEALKRKADSNSSRVKNLEKDCRDLREKMQVLLAKTDNDDSLIAALQNEMQSMARRAKDEQRKERVSETGAAAELQEVKATLRAKETQVDRQQKIIVSLRAELQAAVMRADDSSRGAVQAA